MFWGQNMAGQKIDESITVKEVYERLVNLEAKFDASVDTNKENVRTFTKFVIMLSILGFTNIVVSVLILLAHFKG